jgi:hypothetical protein
MQAGVVRRKQPGQELGSEIARWGLGAGKTGSDFDEWGRP